MPYILGLLTVNSLLLLWFFSPIKTTLSEIFLKKSLMPLEFDDIVYVKSKILGKLTTCWICLSFWTSLITGTVMALIFNLSAFWPLVTFVSYPCLCYIFYTMVKR